MKREEAKIIAEEYGSVAIIMNCNVNGLMSISKVISVHDMIYYDTITYTMVEELRAFIGESMGISSYSGKLTDFNMRVQECWHQNLQKIGLENVEEENSLKSKLSAVLTLRTVNKFLARLFQKL